jgi:predicted house-cleaning noncanonical NTP pyrophosphatase (MazG superfamily)
MPTAPLYILDSDEEIRKLADGNISSDLFSDLEYLTSRSLVIRTDIDSTEKIKCQLLPRSSEIRDAIAAASWLIEQCKTLYAHHSEKFIFILHNFIPASASAFAYAEPNNRTVLIESLWGLPEGLYYYAHDNYSVDTKTLKVENVDKDKIEVSKDCRYKRNFVYPDQDGNWIVGKLKDPYDWEFSIPNTEWIKHIALETRNIASMVNNGVSVMWFIDVDSCLYNCNVFPWYHESYDYVEATSHCNKHKSQFEREFVINGLSDINQLKSDERKYKYILLQPTEVELLRDKDIVAKIGELAKLMDAVIVIEGGILSHLYYQLVHTGAKVEVKQPFKKDTSVVNYNKLVRDRIPEKIQKNGEHATVSKIDDEIKIQLLKRKLVEESFEVLDASTKNDILAELADATEVIDSIRRELKISRKLLADTQKAKREKAGGFDQGIYLHSTANNPASADKSRYQINDQILNPSISKWSDTKKSTTQNEALSRFKIPLSLHEWVINASDSGLPTNKKTELIIRGKRINGIMQIEVSILKPTYKQVSLFDSETD